MGNLAEIGVMLRNSPVPEVRTCAILCANARRAELLRRIVDPERVRVFGLYEPKGGRGQWDAVFAFRDEFCREGDDPTPERWWDWANEMCLGLRPGVPFDVTVI